MAIDEIESGEHMNEASEYRQAVQVIKEAMALRGKGIRVQLLAAGEDK